MDNVLSNTFVDGSIVHLSECCGVKFRHEFAQTNGLDEITIWITKKDASNQKQCIKEYWQEIIIDYFMPQKWVLQEFFIGVENKLVLGSHYYDWSFSRTQSGDVKRFIIETPIKPQSNEIEGYKSVIENKKTGLNLYAFKLTDMRKVIFTKE